jgi:cardiolipin synthase
MKWINLGLITILTILALIAAWHALLYKRDSRASLGWIAVCFIYPFAGPFLYFLFGINRVRARAKKLEEKTPFQVIGANPQPGQTYDSFCATPSVPRSICQIAKISNAVTRHPMTGENRVEILQNGEQAYPAMLAAVRSAERFLFLSTYIFETNRTGRDFISALAEAVRRGVDVKVILDGIGERHSFPWAGSILKKNNIRFARFLPPRLWPPAIHVNLRNHRKLMVADGTIAFVGGMNIGDRHLAENHDNASRVKDVHFRLQGPAVNQIEGAFLEDWAFCTGEVLSPSEPVGEAPGTAVCRIITDGPSEDLDKLSTILVGAVSLARKQISIVTPYFLPSRDMISALKIAALKGVVVSVILPGKNNLPFIHWATRKMLWELLQKGVRVFYQPPPFVHSKLFVIDDSYALIGSANIDPRSLRLNFELAVEIFDKAVVQPILEHIDEMVAQSKEVTLDEMDMRSIPVRTRDALAWLFSPYL